MKKNGFKVFKIILVIVILVTVAFFVYKDYLVPSHFFCPAPSKEVKNYEPPLSVWQEVIYPGSLFIKRTIVEPCDPCRTECRGSLGRSGGAKFSYHVLVPFYDVITWYKDKWDMSGGGGDMESGGEAGTIFGAKIYDKNFGDILYFITIVGDKSETSINFSSSIQTTK
ncbi:hypothetical protein KKG65_01415 [Patescibacteria group bacterium]|nr:hypothetical protein [Patescibacteria group bacterium]